MLRQRRERNPVERTGSGFYARLPRRFSLRGAEWWLGPFRSEGLAATVAGQVRGANGHVEHARRGWVVEVYGGTRLVGAPRLGPYRTAREAANVLGHLLPERPELRADDAPEEKTPAGAPRKAVARSKGAATGNRASEAPAPQQTAFPAAAQDVVNGLRGMGYTATEAREAVERAIAKVGPNAGEAALLRAAFATAKNPRGIGIPCPRCGAAVRVGRAAQVVRCQACGARSAIERRGRQERHD